MAQHTGLGQSEFVIVFTGLGASVMNKMLKGKHINNKCLRFMLFFFTGENEEERKHSGYLQLTRLYSASLHGCKEQSTVHSHVGPTRLGFASEVEKD